MKIDSSTVGMESARDYRTTSVTFRRFTIGEVTQEATGNNTGLNTAVGSNAQNAENAQESETNKTQQPVAELQDWQGRLQMSSSNVTIRDSVSQALADLRETTLRYIFDILFSGRRSRMKPWMQGNGYSESTSQGASASQGQSSQEAYMQGTYSQGMYAQGTYSQGMYMQGAYSQGIYFRGAYSLGTNFQSAYTQIGYSGGQQNVQMSSGMIGAYQNLLINQQRTPTANVKVLNYSEDRLQIESEDTAFSTVGTVRTADGREINFNVNVGMSREFQEHFQEDLQISSFKMCDPLVINLNTDVAELSDQTFYFDIDGDGEKDEISQLGSGSGYLALDKNGDGQINDGIKKGG